MQWLWQKGGDIPKEVTLPKKKLNKQNSNKQTKKYFTLKELLEADPNLERNMTTHQGIENFSLHVRCYTMQRR